MGLPEPKASIFIWKIAIFYATAPRWHRGGTGGKDNLAPAEDLHNKNPSLVALGKKMGPCWGAGVVPMAPQRPRDHFYHVKTPNGATWTRFSPFLMFAAIFLYINKPSLSLSLSL